MKDKIKLKWSSDISAAPLSAEKDLVKRIKEVGLTINPKKEREGSSLKKGCIMSTHSHEVGEDLISP